MNGSSVSQVHHSLCLCAFRSMPMRMAFHLKAFLFGIRTHSGHLDMYVLMISSHTLKLAKRPSPQNSLVLRENRVYLFGIERGYMLAVWYTRVLVTCHQAFARRITRITLGFLGLIHIPGIWLPISSCKAMVRNLFQVKVVVHVYYVFKWKTLSLTVVGRIIGVSIDYNKHWARIQPLFFIGISL